MEILVSLIFSVFVSLVITLLLHFTPDSGFGLKELLVTFAVILIFSYFCGYYELFNFDERKYSRDIWYAKEKEEKPKNKSSEESKPKESIDKLTPPSKLSDVSEKWLNSYDDGKFSTYELYLLSDVQSLTRVKVYEEALSLKKSSSNTTPDSFRDLLFKANRTLNLINTAK